MRQITLFKETEKSVFNLNDHDFVQWLTERKHLISDGYRIYAGKPSKKRDITRDPTKIAKAKKLVILKPAHGDPLTIGLVIVASIIVSAVAVKLLAPKIDTPNGSRAQSSSTNRFSDRKNELRLGERVDDVWGKVSRFTPSLIQLPRTYYRDGNEIEVFAMACMGKGLIENVRDGETSFNRLTGGKFNSWSAGSDLLGSPDYQIGGIITEPINSISKSDELQSQELLPPNDVDLETIDLKATTIDNGNSTYTVTISTPDEIDFQGLFDVGETITLREFFRANLTGSQSLYGGTSTTTEIVFNTHDIIDLSGAQVIDSLTENSLTFTTSNSDWDGLSDYSPVTSYARYSNSEVDFFSTDPNSDSTLFSYENGVTFISISIEEFDKEPSGTKINENYVGPIKPPKDTDTIHLNFSSTNGFYELYKGNERSLTVSIEVLFEELDSNNNLTGLSFVETFQYSSKEKVTQPTGYTHTTSKPSYDNYQLSCKRITDRNKSANVQAVDKVVWNDAYFEKSVPLPDNSDFTIMQAEIPSSPVSRSVKERRLNLDWTRIHNPYIGNGQFGAEQPISTFAETIIGLSLDKYNGRVNLDAIDADTLLSVQDELIAYYGFNECVEVGYDFDNTKVRFQSAYQLLCNAVNCKAYAQGGVFKAYPDINRTESSKQFTHRYKVSGSDTKASSFKDQYDGIELTYRDNETGRFNSLVKHVNGINSYNRLTLELSGCVNSKVAEIRANRELNILKNQRYTYSFDADGIARLTILSERVDNVDYTRIVKRDNNLNNYKIYSGFVEMQDGLTLQLSEPVHFEEGQPHSIRFTKRNGDLMEAISCQPGCTEYHVVLDASPSEDIYTGYNGEKTGYTFASDSDRLSMPVIVRKLKAKEKGGVKLQSITAINYSEDYYKDDLEFKV